MSIEKFEGNFSKEDLGVSILVNSTIQSITDGNALAVYCYLASKPNDWRISPREIMKHFNWGQDKTYQTLTKLIDLNLLTRTEVRESGKIVAIEYTLFLKPRASTDSSPLPDFPDTVKPYTVNQDYTKHRELQSKEFTKTPSISPPQLSTEDMIENNPHDIPTELIEEWRVNRKKHPITKTVWNRLNRVLSQLRELGFSPLDCFERMVASGWRSLEVSYFDKDGRGNRPEVDFNSTAWASMSTSWVKP